MERRRSGRGGWGRDLAIFLPQRAHGRGRRLGKAIESCGTYPGLHSDTFPQAYEVSRVTKISRLVELTWAMRREVFSDSIVTRRSRLVELTSAAVSRWRHFRTNAALRCT